MVANRHWTETQIQSLRAAWRDTAWSLADIATALGRSKHAVSNKAHEINLGPRPGEVSRGSATRLRAQILHAQRGTQPRIPHKVAKVHASGARLIHARELLRRGIRLETVLAGVRLAPEEQAELLRSVG
jgi:hypothetical protein